MLKITIIFKLLKVTFWLWLPPWVNLWVLIFLTWCIDILSRKLVFARILGENLLTSYFLLIHYSLFTAYMYKLESLSSKSWAIEINLKRNTGRDRIRCWSNLPFKSLLNMSMISCPIPRVHPFPSVFNQQKKKIMRKFCKKV